MKRLLVAILGASATAHAVGLFLRYRRDLNAARMRLTAVERHVVSTKWGAVEYAERGDGDPCSWCMESFTTASGDSFPSETC